MKLRILVLTILTSTAAGIQAQHASCDSDRFLLPVFNEVDIAYDVLYGHNTTLDTAEQDLLMDIYTPVGDTLAERPLIVMAHGGAFIQGDRSQTQFYCEEFTKKGYVVANIAYRLIDQLVTDSVAMFRAALMATHDMRAAVRYLRDSYSKGNLYGVDTSYIFAAGVSAGGIMASQLGFWDSDDEVPSYMQEIVDEQGGFEGSSNDITAFNSRVHGVLNYSGALFLDDWVDADDVPIFSAHDELDPIVACGYGSTSLLPFPVYTYGSCVIKAKADELGIPNQLYLVPDSDGHVSYADHPSQVVEVLHKSSLFLKSILCQTVDIAPLPSLASVSVFPNPFTDRLHIQSTEDVKEIRIYDIQGRTVRVIPDYAGGPVDLASLPGGLYIIHISTLQNNIVRKIQKLF